MDSTTRAPPPRWRRRTVLRIFPWLWRHEARKTLPQTLHLIDPRRAGFLRIEVSYHGAFVDPKSRVVLGAVNPRRNEEPERRRAAMVPTEVQ